MKERIKYFIKSIGISVALFEKNCGLSNGSVNKMADGTRTTTLDNISKAYPQLNMNWLKTGEGEMLNSEINQSVEGNNNTSVAGNSNNVNSSSTIDKAIDEISAQRKLTEKAMAQIEKLVDIINQLSKS